MLATIFFGLKYNFLKFHIKFALKGGFFFIMVYNILVFLYRKDGSYEIYSHIG